MEIDSDVEDSDRSDADEVFSPLSSPNRRIPFPSTQPALAVGHHHDGSEDEEVPVINISGKKINFYQL